ncbi:hypothetical protein ROT00_01775 [Agromyces mediolanus]|uniref:hypothetical protein n=1 Tax=Agromyces mediolanus TaxID=41986 RepID=UPI003837109C
MRFVLAIVAFVAAAVLIGLGIAQRTVFLEPARVSLTAAIDEPADYVVIEPDALAAHPGKQTLSAAGDGTVFLAYGRSSDVEAWVRSSDHVTVRYDAETDALVTERVPAETDAPAEEPPADGTAAEPPAAPTTPATPEAPAADTATLSPAGSDLWLDQFTGDRRVTTTIAAPEGISVIVASGSEDPAPDQVVVAWPLDNSTPWAGPLLVGGSALFVVGLVLLLLGILHHRRSRGPRRNLPKGPRGLRRGASQAAQSRALGKGRRAILAPIVLVPALALTACSADYWPSFEQAPQSDAATATPGPTESEAPAEGEPAEESLPAVTEPQMERIMRTISEFTVATDEARASDALETRFTGPALEARAADYTIRGTLPDQTQALAIPPGPLSVMLPQQTSADPTTGWPRTVLTVMESSEDAAVAPTALVLQQDAPRDQYHVLYTMSLVPGPEFPDVAPASIGAPIIAPEYKGLTLAPSQVSTAFADILMKGAESEYAPLFDLEGTDLDDTLNATARANEVQGANPTITLSVSAVAGDAPVVALATNDAGALVSTLVRRTEQSRPNDGGTTGFKENTPARALSGFTEQSAKGVQSTRDLQLLFYVPAVGTDEPIRLLGWSESLVSASEVQ